MMETKHQIFKWAFVAVMIGTMLCLSAAPRIKGQTSTQTTEPAAPPEPQTSIQTLELGKSIERELAGGQAHDYQITLQKDQFLHVVVEQKGIDVVVTLFGPDGKQLVEVDSPNGDQGPEPVTFITEAIGVYRLSVKSLEKNAFVGKYEIRVKELRVSTVEDRALIEKNRLLQEATKLTGEAQSLRIQGKYDAALPLAEGALAIYEKALGAEHRDTAPLLNNLAFLYEAKGEYAKAEPLFIRALAIREKTLGADHPSTAFSLNNLASFYQEEGDYAKAEPLFIRALAIREKALGAEHPLTSESLNNLAVLYQEKGDYAKAEPPYLRALAISEKALGAEHRSTLSSLNNLAFLYARKGDYAKAELLFLRALAIREKTLDAEKPSTLISLNNLAGLYESKGDYVKAEPLYLRALAICEKTLGADHPATSKSLNKLASLYQEKGDYAKAEPLFIRALTINEKALGAEHRDTAPSLNDLANLYESKGEYAKAEPLFIRALAINEKALGAENPSTAISLINLASLYQAKGEYGKAEPLFIRALTIFEKTLGTENPDTAVSLNKLASLYQEKGDYAKAEPLYLRALAIREKTLGAEHRNTAVSLNNLADLYRAIGDYAKAVDFQSRCNDVSEHDLVRNLAPGSERQKLTYLNQTSLYTDLTISLHAQSAPNSMNAKRAAIKILLQRKGRALDAMTDSVAALRRRVSPEDQKLLTQLEDVRSQLSVLTLKGLVREGFEKHKANLKALEEQEERLQNEISQSSAEFRAQSQSQTQSKPATIEVIQKAIPQGAVLIEFAQYRLFDPKETKNEKRFGESHYVAYVLPSQGESLWVELGDAELINEKIDALRKALRDKRRQDVKQLARALDAKVMQPVRKLIGKTKWLLISPDGALNLVPFGALVDQKGHYLIQNYQFTYLTSGRDLLRLQVPIAAKQGALVMANPDFGGKSPTEEDRKLKLTQATQAPPEQTPTHLFSKFYFPPLPGTADEGEALRRILPNATLLMQRQATKAALKQVDGPIILHIATHGFFLEDLETGPLDARALQLASNDPARLLLQQRAAGTAGWRVENPLLRSGLALAGANEHKSDDDGIMTALEVSGLSLWGTKLVVLSACDTGLGEVKNGDGVYGLRRALVLAGSESQIISLWPVNDAATRDLMIDYYNALRAGQGRSEALRNVQLKMLKGPKRSHPAYWASFIESGQWKNLDGTE